MVQTAPVGIVTVLPVAIVIGPADIELDVVETV
jgi:hypothetical protein